MFKEIDMKQLQLLNYEQSLNAVEQSGLTEAQKYLITLLLSEGRCFMRQFPDMTELIPIIDVTRFLNHRVDGELLRHIRNELGESVSNMAPDVLLTATTSGVAPATAQALYTKNGSVSLVIARKDQPPITMEEVGVFTEDSRSYTGRGRPVTLFIAQDAIDPREAVVISDEFLDYGVTTQGLGNLVSQAGAQLKGCVYVIEKLFSGGREYLKETLSLSDENIISLLVLEAAGEGWMKVQGIDQTLRFRKT